jgi:type IV secretory pathway VirJ component
MQLTEEETKLTQRSKPKSKTRKSALNKGAANILEDTLATLNRLTKDAETTLSKVRRAVKDASQNVASGAGDLASHLPVVGNPKKGKPKAHKATGNSKKRASSKSVASTGPSGEKSTASASKKSDSAPKARAARKPAASKSSE